MDNDFINLLYKYAFVPLSIVFWWLFKKIDYRLDKSEQNNYVIQKEFELRMQTMEKALELRVQGVEKNILVVNTKLDVIQRDLANISKGQEKLFDLLRSKRGSDE